MKIPKTTHNKIERQIKGINYAVIIGRERL